MIKKIFVKRKTKIWKSNIDVSDNSEQILRVLENIIQFR